MWTRLTGYIAVPPVGERPVDGLKAFSVASSTWPSQSDFIHQHKAGNQAISRWNFTINLAEELRPLRIQTSTNPHLRRELRCRFMRTYSLQTIGRLRNPLQQERTGDDDITGPALCVWGATGPSVPPTTTPYVLLSTSEGKSPNYFFFFLVGNGLLYNLGQFNNYSVNFSCGTHVFPKVFQKKRSLLKRDANIMAIGWYHHVHETQNGQVCDYIQLRQEQYLPFSSRL